MKISVGLYLLLLELFFGCSGRAAMFRFANIFGSHMVLQKAPSRALIWGFGEVGQKVFLTAGNKIYHSKIKKGKFNKSDRVLK